MHVRTLTCLFYHVSPCQLHVNTCITQCCEVHEEQPTGISAPNTYLTDTDLLHIYTTDLIMSITVHNSVLFSLSIDYSSFHH